jgi:hypothetical protein
MKDESSLEIIAESLVTKAGFKLVATAAGDSLAALLPVLSARHYWLVLLH